MRETRTNGHRRRSVDDRRRSALLTGEPEASERATRSDRNPAGAQDARLAAASCTNLHAVVSYRVTVAKRPARRCTRMMH